MGKKVILNKQIVVMRTKLANKYGFNNKILHLIMVKRKMQS